MGEFAEKRRRKCLAVIEDYAREIAAPGRPWREQTLASADK
ncbi:MAG: hypothetical protein QW794_08155 [Thermosphaera sp.]